MKTKVFSRQELYDKVWSIPLQSILQQFDVSYSEFRKICVDMNIPQPQVGHWQKIRFKKDVTQLPLPLNYEGKVEITLAVKDEKASKTTGRKLTSSILYKEIESELETSFKLPEQLAEPDKLVIAAKKHLEGRKVDNYEYIGTKDCGSDYLNMRMAVENVGRALCIMDTLIRALRVRGHNLEVKNHSTVLIVYGQEFKILLREKMKRTVSVKNSWSRTVLMPTGILCIKLDSYLHKEWMDGKLKLEEQLSAIIAYLEIKAKEENEREVE